MTTILWTGDAIYADTQSTCGDNIEARYEKVRRLSDGSVWTHAGEPGRGWAIGEWLAGNGEKPDKTENSVTGILIRNRQAFEVTNDLFIYPIKAPWSLGSGGHMAMIAYRCGKSGREAVEMACEMDIWSSGPVTEFVL